MFKKLNADNNPGFSDHGSGTPQSGGTGSGAYSPDMLTAEGGRALNSSSVVSAAVTASSIANTVAAANASANPYASHAAALGTAFPAT